MKPGDEEFRNLRAQAEKRLGAAPDTPTRPAHQMAVYDEELRIQAENLLQTNQQLERELARTRELFHEAPMAYLVLDAHGRILEANRVAADAIGVLRGQLVGRPLLGFLKPGAAPHILDQMRRTLAGESAECREVTLRPDEDGQPRAIWETHMRRWSFDDGPSACLVLCKNVSSLRSTEAQLQEAREQAERSSHLKGRFLANMSHEVRTPLALVLGYVDTLLARELEDEVNRRLKVIRRAGQDLLHVLNDVVDFSKIDANQLTIANEPTNLPDLFSHLLQLFSGSATLNEVAVSIQGDTKSPAPEWALADRARVVQVLINLISNAIKFTPAGGEVLVVYAYRSGNLVVTVQDTGRGIPEDQLAYVFEAFRQVDASDSREHGGAGLGLAISRNLVNLMRGEIFARNTELGACFTVQLPMPQSGPPRQPPASSTRPVAAGEEHRLLVVEDDEDMRDLIAILLEQLGYACEFAVNGAEGLAAIAAGSFDLVLMDVQMPVMDGLEAIDRLRASVETADLPVIALTARTMRDQQEEMQRAGFNALVAKPIDVEVLDREIRGLLLP